MFRKNVQCYQSRTLATVVDIDQQKRPNLTAFFKNKRLCSRARHHMFHIHVVVRHVGGKASLIVRPVGPGIKRACGAEAPQALSRTYAFAAVLAVFLPYLAMKASTESCASASWSCFGGDFMR